MIGVVPMAYHQHVKSAQDEIRISATVYREVYEELFNGREVRRQKEAWRPPTWFFEESEPLSWLITHPEAYWMECVGMTINLLYGNYDFHVVFAVRDPEFWARFGVQLQRSWEARSLTTVSSKASDRLAVLLRRRRWASQALVAMVEGLLRLRAVAPEAVNLPEMERYL